MKLSYIVHELGLISLIEYHWVDRKIQRLIIVPTPKVSFLPADVSKGREIHK